MSYGVNSIHERVQTYASELWYSTLFNFDSRAIVRTVYRGVRICREFPDSFFLPLSHAESGERCEAEALRSSIGVSGKINLSSR